MQTTPNPDLDLSIIIPVYNEEKTVIRLLKKLEHLKKKLNTAKLEIIIINDGSTDKSKTLINENKELFDKAHHLKNNQGKGKCLSRHLSLD